MKDSGYVFHLGDDTWKADDAEWFSANPRRSHRLRPRFCGETFADESRWIDLPEGHEVRVVVRQVMPGVRIRKTLAWNREVPIPDDEFIVHAIFDLVSGVKSRGETISTTEVRDVAMAYANASNRRPS